MPLWQRLAKIPRTLRQPNAVLLTTRELPCTAGGCRFSCMVWVWYTTGVPTNITKQPRAPAAILAAQCRRAHSCPAPTVQCRLRPGAKHKE